MTAPRRRWFQFSLATLFVVLTLVGAIAATIRSFPGLAIFLAFLAGVLVVWLGAVVLGAVVLQAVVSAITHRINRVFGLKDSPATPPDRP